jgi:ABC-type polysaccharide/polyol phosphate export permease
MFKRKVSRTKLQAASELWSVIYHLTARNIRGGGRSAVYSVLSSIGIAVLLMILMAALMVYGFRIRSSPIRGDFLLYIMTGILLFTMHVRTFKSVAGAGGETAGTMKHAQASTPAQLFSGALAALYTQILTILLILLVYDLVWEPLHISQPIGALSMVVLSWFTAVCIGIVFLALTPWSPGVMQRMQQIYVRANFIASGKMFLGNSLSEAALPFFDWNPLFHIIDQTRGFVFVNYFPRNTNTIYPLYFALVALVIGMMIEFVTRRNASASWGKGGL